MGEEEVQVMQDHSHRVVQDNNHSPCTEWQGVTLPHNRHHHPVS